MMKMMVERYFAGIPLGGESFSVFSNHLAKNYIKFFQNLVIPGYIEELS